MTDPLQESLHIREAVVADSSAIVQLYLQGSCRSLSRERVDRHIASWPAAVAESAGKVVGFAFCTPFAPDVVELANVFVEAGMRCNGVGSRLVREIERQSEGRFHSIILSNSMLHVGVPGKRSAADFYQRLGYLQIWSTGPTSVFARRLKS